jgi:hypothetical protein
LVNVKNDRAGNTVVVVWWTSLLLIDTLEISRLRCASFEMTKSGGKRAAKAAERMTVWAWLGELRL